VKTVEQLIQRVRRDTKNATTGLTSAGTSIQDTQFVDRLQDAQELCVELISGVFSSLFEETIIYTIDTTATNYEVITLPVNMLLGTRIVLFEYSHSGREEDYQNVPPVNIRERYSGGNFQRGVLGYIHSNNTVILSEKTNQNGAKIRLTYEKRLLRLDIAKAVIASGSRSGTDYSGVYTTGTANADFVSELSVGDLITVLDRSSNSILIDTARLTAINTGTGAFTLDLTDATYTVATVDAATATNLRLIEGGRTNVSQLPHECEKFLTAYAIMDILDFDGSKLAAAAAGKFGNVQESILKSYLHASKDWLPVPDTGF
jgi:hypothetical protein